MKSHGATESDLRARHEAHERMKSQRARRGKGRRTRRLDPVTELLRMLGKAHAKRQEKSL